MYIGVEDGVVVVGVLFGDGVGGVFGVGVVDGYI